ncbi:iron chelate uptake ABC transporter family permease subunit [Ureaplasma canigenitalium]|uniref:iron chelate uptake ABC transporter family permease subunit n=1 Tax=Ureaplasma canigenitalium TaxID=42092 RepID=UPI00068CB3D3|nr:iron chelate uptake ABC transporter family permease subunit [Ureaplasma canigenitalium]
MIAFLEQKNKDVLTSDKKKQTFFLYRKPKGTRFNYLQIFFITLSVILGFLFFIVNLFYDANILNNFDRLFSDNVYDVGLYVFNPISNYLVGFCLGASAYAVTVTSKNVLSGPTTLGFTPMLIVANTITYTLTIDAGYATASLYCLGLLFCFVLIITNFLLTKGNVHTQTFRPILISFAIGATVSAVNVVIITQIDDLRRQFSSFVGFTPYLITLDRFLTSNILMMIATVIIFLLSSRLTIIKKSYLLARSLGIKVNLVYWTVAISLVIVTVSSFILIGVIVLFGVVINVIVSSVFQRENVPRAMLFSGLFGAGILSFAGYVAEYFPGSREIIIVVLALPTFIYVLFRRKENAT